MACVKNFGSCTVVSLRREILSGIQGTNADINHCFVIVTVKCETYIAIDGRAGIIGREGPVRPSDVKAFIFV